MREITTHNVNGCNESIDITVLDEPGSGNANHHYRLTMIPPECWEPQADGSVMLDVEKTAGVRKGFDIQFQKGPIKEAGVNGMTNEALLAVVIDRLQCFQKGQFACRENALALTKLEEGMQWLQHRTRERLKRGVEGTHTK